MAYRMTDVVRVTRGFPPKVCIPGAIQEEEPGVWVPSRWLQFNDGCFWLRIYDAWLVFRGRAQAVIWR